MGRSCVELRRIAPPCTLRHRYATASAACSFALAAPAIQRLLSPVLGMFCALHQRPVFSSTMIPDPAERYAQRSNRGYECCIAQIECIFGTK